MKSIPSHAHAVPLTPQQRAILQLLYEYCYLDTPTLHAVIAPRVTERALRRSLCRLEARTLIVCHRHPATSTIYGLTVAGARAIGQSLSRQHYRMPGRAVFVYRTTEARIAAHAQRQGFVVYRGTPASPLSTVRALQNQTRAVVVQHWRAREKAAIALAEAAGERVGPRKTQLAANVHPVPHVFREWYIHRPGMTGRIVLVARKEESHDYWHARIADMAEVGALLPVVCIFVHQPPADLRSDLERAGFEVILLPHIDTVFGTTGA